MKRILYFFLVAIFFGCEFPKESLPLSALQFTVHQKNNLSDSTLLFWHLKDIEFDTIPGISFERVLKNILPYKKPNETIIAIIDSEIDSNHPDIKPLIWVNHHEIPKNNVDDDNNGYVDDLNGWNFLGNKNGENSLYSNFEVTRIVRFYQNEFYKDTSDIPNSKEYKLYEEAKILLEKDLKIAETIVQNGPRVLNTYAAAFENLKPYIKEEDFTLEKLDSIVELYPFLMKDIDLAKDAVTGNQSLEEMEMVLKTYQNTVNYHLNIDYNEREKIGDDPNDLNDKYYGNNQISNNSYQLNHGTKVAGVISSIVNNKYLADKIKIMPLVISNFGDEQDKDMVLAIRYAVDNGAEIINISSSKKFSLHKSWVIDAIKYAEANDVLIITSGGNESSNLDEFKLFNYPNDTDENNTEVVSNFIKVGASGYSLDENIYATFSNYGQNEVDIFAPGVNIYTTSATNESGFEFTEGTSVAAPMVSGIAALLKSYYPHLTAKELKEIILQSGVTYKNCVTVLDSNGEKETIPFNLLSKSGKIVNAYNAFVLAARIR